jgi:hypothetical protein
MNKQLKFTNKDQKLFQFNFFKTLKLLILNVVPSSVLSLHFFPIQRRLTKLRYCVTE